MIQKISIKNFKSVHNNEMELGRFNVLIGENGSGKSNILEAIAFGGAASANMLNNEFLASRGIRVTKPELMFSGFIQNKSKEIGIAFNSAAKIQRTYLLNYSKKGGWIDLRSKQIVKQMQYYADAVFSIEKYAPKLSNSKSIIGEKKHDAHTFFMDSYAQIAKSIPKNQKNRATILSSLAQDAFLKYEASTFSIHSNISDFLIYSPENTALRNFFDEGQITPLGIRGEGVFSLLKEISLEKRGNRFKKIIDSLKIIDWFEGLELEANGFTGEKGIKIKDKYISDSIKYIDQRSTNEGFLFLLFYITLFVSDKTPDFFAIDNIEASFNPKLCIKLIQVLAKLAKEHKKQVIVTTHNPFILDGLNLADNDQRLFVVRRNLEGHTITNRVQPKEKLTVPLSEAWMRGYIGGLPNNF
jgi:predicted ATPase